MVLRVIDFEAEDATIGRTNYGMLSHEHCRIRNHLLIQHNDHPKSMACWVFFLDFKDVTDQKTLILVG